MKIKPEVSVCVTAFNHEHYIEKCLISILGQNVNFAYEVIVGVDKSDDATLDKVISICKDKQNVRIVPFTERVGADGNYIKIHSLATADYVAHCDGDDYWLPDKLLTQYKFMKENREIVQTWHRMLVFNDEGLEFIGAPIDKPSNIFKKNNFTTADLAKCHGFVGMHSSRMYRRDAHPPFEIVRGMCDYHISIIISEKGESIYLDEILGGYRANLSEESISRASNGSLVNLMYSNAFIYIIKIRPELKRKIFNQALFRFLMAVKNNRGGKVELLRVLFKAFSLIDLKQIYLIWKIIQAYNFRKVFLSKK